MPKTSNSPLTKRDEIILIASDLFYRQGYGATGIKQIIDQAGIAKGTFYSHFASKEILGTEWLRKRHFDWNTWLDESIKFEETAGAKILAAFDFLKKWLTDSDFRGCAFINTMAEIPDAASPMRAETLNHKKHLLSKFQKLVADHSPADTTDQQEHIGSSIFLLFEGALVESQNFQETWAVDSAKRQVQSLLQSTQK